MSARRMVEWMSRVALTLCVVASVPHARADTPSTSAPASAVVPPRLVSPSTVDYPPEARGEARVVMVLTVNADGTVRSARVSEGEAPFADAAVRAAENWRFEPATRDGRAIAAVIRFEVVFKPPAPSSEATAPNVVPAPSSSEEARPVSAEPDAIDVVISGEKLAPAVSSFSQAEVRQLPGAFGDPFRAIEALPGVTPIISGLPFFYVRGAPPGNVGYFIDGIRVPYLYHVGLGPSVIHPGMVGRVDLYPGGYPARFGRFAGGIVSGETTAPRHDWHGQGNVRLFDLGAMTETGFAGGRGTALMGGRYSYTAALLSLLAPDAELAYRDYQARISYDFTPRDRVTVTSFGAYDLVAEKEENVRNVLFGAEFYRLDLRYQHFFGASSVVQTSVTLGYDQTRLAFQGNLRDRMVAVRSELRHHLDKRVLLRAGTDVMMNEFGGDRFTYVDADDPDARSFSTQFPARIDLAWGGYADVVWSFDRFELTPGLRVDLFSSGGATAVGIDPRIAARFKVSDRLRIVHAYGVAHQPPSFVIPLPGWAPGRLRGGLQKSIQTSAGVELDLPESTTATATVFHNAFFDMTDVLGASGPEETEEDWEGFSQRSRGSALGFELFVHRRLTSRLGGYLSYTLSRSSRTAGRASFASTFDRTHVASGALAYNLGRNWRAGTRLVFYTGIPQSAEGAGIGPVTSRNLQRSPAFYRVDVRLEKRWTFSETTWLSLIFEVLNATLSKETFGKSEIGPITIPSIGVEAAF